MAQHMAVETSLSRPPCAWQPVPLNSLSVPPSIAIYIQPGRETMPPHTPRSHAPGCLNPSHSHSHSPPATSPQPLRRRV